MNGFGVPEIQWVASNALAFAIRDAFPVAEGHTLVITRRGVGDWFEATRDEQLAVLDLVETVKRQLDEELKPDGYNVGFNAGVAAGQTVMHLHVHVIPRHAGDMDDPRGGVRHVIPWKGNYKRSAAAPLVVGGTNDPFLAHIRPLIAEAREVAIVAAFVQDSGLELLQDPVFSAAERGARFRLVTGDYLDITQAEALKRMLDWQGALSPVGASPRFEAIRSVSAASRTIGGAFGGRACGTKAATFSPPTVVRSYRPVVRLAIDVPWIRLLDQARALEKADVTRPEG